MHAGDSLKHLDKLAGAIALIRQVLRQEFDVVQQLAKLGVSAVVGLGLGVNYQPLNRPECPRKVVRTNHGITPKSKPTSSILVPGSPPGWTVIDGYGKT